jgi:hypothetical protein
MMRLVTWLVSTILGASAIPCAFFHPTLAWFIIALPELFLIWMSISLTGREWTWNQYEELSAEAKAMFQRYGHFYSMPHAASDFSAAARLLWKVNVLLTAIGLLKGFWWGLAIGLPSVLGMIFLAGVFDPGTSIKIPSQRAIHQEIMSKIFPADQ